MDDTKEIKQQPTFLAIEKEVSEKDWSEERGTIWDLIYDCKDYPPTQSEKQWYKRYKR